MSIDIDVDSFNRKIEECKDYGYDINKTLEVVKDSLDIEIVSLYAGFGFGAIERKANFVFN